MIPGLSAACVTAVPWKARRTSSAFRRPSTSSRLEEGLSLTFREEPFFSLRSWEHAERLPSFCWKMVILAYYPFKIRRFKSTLPARSISQVCRLHMPPGMTWAAIWFWWNIRMLMTNWSNSADSCRGCRHMQAASLDVPSCSRYDSPVSKNIQ